MSLLLGTLLLCYSVTYARADVRTYGTKTLPRATTPCATTMRST